MNTPINKPDCMGNCPTTGEKCVSSGCGNGCIKMNDTPTLTPIDLDNFPLNEALRFADENSTTGGLVTQASLKTLAAKCRELTTVTEQRDRLAEAIRKHKFDDVKLWQALQSLTQDHTVDSNDMIADVKGGADES